MIGTWHVDSQAIFDSAYSARDRNPPISEPGFWQFERTGYPVNAVNLQAYPTAPILRYPFVFLAPDTLRLMPGTAGPGFDRLALLFTRHLELWYVSSFAYVFPGTMTYDLNAHFVAYLHRTP